MRGEFCCFWGSQRHSSKRCWSKRTRLSEALWSPTRTACDLLAKGRSSLWTSSCLWSAFSLRSFTLQFCHRLPRTFSPCSEVFPFSAANCRWVTTRYEQYLLNNSPHVLRAVNEKRAALAFELFDSLEVFYHGWTFYVSNVTYLIRLADNGGLQLVHYIYSVVVRLRARHIATSERGSVINILNL